MLRRLHHEGSLHRLSTIHLLHLLHLLHLEELLLHLGHHLVVGRRTVILVTTVVEHLSHHRHEVLLLLSIRLTILLLVAITVPLLHFHLLLHFADLVLLDDEADLIVSVLRKLLEFGRVTSLSQHAAVLDY